ncbi:hypothetical protein, partial [Xanthomonas graminis]|uniref:hypothetical protein n=1 Tax=Xanthomonas graminis TaxID=3390026 RepID=UPI001C8F7856
MLIKKEIMAKLGPSEMSGHRLNYYQDQLSGLYESASSHVASIAHLTAHNVSYLKRPLSPETSVGAFELSPIDFCRLFMVFNDAR